MIRWGGLILDDVQVSTGRRRAFVRHQPARGSGGSVLDAGAELREWRVTVHWTRRSNDDDPEQRYAALKAHNDGNTRLLVIPGERSVPAKLSIESEDRSRGHLDSVLMFVEDRGDDASGDDGMSMQTAIQVVQERAQAAENALRALQLPVDVAANSRALAEAWRTSGEREVADIDIAADAQRAAISTTLTETGAVHDPDKLDLYFALLDLSAALDDAAERAAARAPGRIALTIDEPATLLSLAASLYGAESAETRVAEIVRLNQLRGENVLAAPATLLIPAVS